jgi:hypothetical protein
LFGSAAEGAHEKRVFGLYWLLGILADHGGRVKTAKFIVTGLLFSFLLGFPSHQYAQNDPAQTDSSEHSKRSRAVSFLRAINTTEMVYRTQYGSFASWHILLLSEKFVFKSVAEQEPQPPFVQLDFLRVVPPGWNLRLNLTADGQGYDALLEDKTDKEHGYALLTDERGLIRESTVVH